MVDWDHVRWQWADLVPLSIGRCSWRSHDIVSGQGRVCGLHPSCSTCNRTDTNPAIGINSFWQNLWPDRNRSSFSNTVFCLENRPCTKSISPVIHSIMHSSQNSLEFSYIIDFLLRMDRKMIEKLLTWMTLLQPIRNGWMLIHLKWCWWIWGIASHRCKEMKVMEEMKGQEKPQPLTADPVSWCIGWTHCI